jgi:hypothetical protein
MRKKSFRQERLEREAKDRILRQKENRIEQLEQQAKDDYLGDIEWNFVLAMLDDVEYAELKNLYLEMNNSMHTIMDDRGQEEGEEE